MLKIYNVIARLMCTRWRKRERDRSFPDNASAFDSVSDGCKLI